MAGHPRGAGDGPLAAKTPPLEIHCLLFDEELAWGVNLTD
jgi:hypothetical protein